jgi:hypothetical protein
MKTQKNQLFSMINIFGMALAVLKAHRVEAADDTGCR